MMTTTVAMTTMTTEEKAGGLKKETRKRTTPTTGSSSHHLRRRTYRSLRRRAKKARLQGCWDPLVLAPLPSVGEARPRWERRLKLWEKRVLAWMPAGEAAMLLLESLTGIAELETEHLALEKVNCETGIQTILDALRAPLSERSLYLKRLYLQEWETVGRQQGESVRDFVTGTAESSRICNRCRSDLRRPSLQRP